MWNWIISDGFNNNIVKNSHIILLCLCLIIGFSLLYSGIRDIDCVCKLEDRPSQVITSVDMAKIKALVDSMEAKVNRRWKEYDSKPCTHEYHEILTPCSPQSCIDSSLVHWCKEHNVKYE